MTLSQEREKRLVLIVDDDRSERFLISQALEHAGFSIETAVDGQDALEKFERFSPDVVLMDVEMPKMNGFDACVALRLTARGKSVPILMVTGHTDEASIAQSYRAGATDFITKPLNWTVLGHRVRYLLRASKVFRENEALLRAMPDSLFRMNLDGIVLDHPGSLNTHFFNTNEPVGKSVRDMMPRNCSEILMAANRLAHKTRTMQAIEFRRLSLEWTTDFEVRIETIKDDESLVVVRDITEQKKTEMLTLRLARVLDHSSNEIYIFDSESMHIIQANTRACENLGYTSEELAHMSPLDIEPDMSRQRFLSIIEPLWQGKREYVDYEWEHQRKDGSRYPVEVMVHFSKDEEPPVFVAIVHDITERKKASERIQYLAYYDSLTGLPNRALFNEKLKFCISVAKRRKEQFAILFIDIDRFKRINDTLGHTVGDLLLKNLATRMKGCLRETDLFINDHLDENMVDLARLGGDEFIILLNGINRDLDPAKVAQRILDIIAEPCLLDGHEVIVTPSIGISIFPRDGEDMESLMKHADVAMYNAKKQGKNNFQFYADSMNEKALDRLKLESCLRKALDRNQFSLMYQPQIDIFTQKVIGVEALIRWHHPEWGVVSPAEFIPLAEEIGLILPVGEWVLREACTQAKAWQDMGLPPITMGVNLSSRQFLDNELRNKIAAILEETQLDPKYLELELTESIIMSNAQQTVNTLIELKHMGIRLSVDDFGTGYSSLSYLKQFPLDTLKIDRSFIWEISDNQDDALIVTAIFNLARGFQLDIIAEGVETIQQLEFLKKLGHCTIQGFLFSRPLDAKNAAQFMRECEDLVL